MHTAYLLLGSNLGNRLSYFQQSKQLISEVCGSIINQSSVYETAAWGITEQPSFYNQVIVLQTNLSPDNLMQSLLNIEEQIGRKRTVKYGPRIIDIDILLIDSLIQTTDLHSLPHPFLLERRFALLPLAEIAPLLFHPLANKTILELLQDCTDTLEVKKVESVFS